MDSTAFDDHSLPVDLEASANPGHLQEISISNQLDYTDDSGGGPMANIGHVSPFRTRTMKEYDQQISDLKKENFSLKLRIYFLEEKMQQKFATYGKGEDIGRENIELKVELESLKRELVDKQELLFSASQALETLETQHQIEIDGFRDRKSKDKLHFEQRINELEQQLEAINGGSNKAGGYGCLSKRLSEEWFRQAFSIADLTVDNSGSPGSIVSSLQQKLCESEAAIEALNNNLRSCQIQIKELESNVEAKDDSIKKLEQNQLKRNKAIQGLIEKVHEKNTECDVLQKELEKQTEELKDLKTNLSSTRRDVSVMFSACGQPTEREQIDTRQANNVATLEQTSFDLQIKDSRIKDLCEQVRQLQASLESQAKDKLQKDELVAKLQNSLEQAERHSEELLAQTKKSSETEEVIKELRLVLQEKEDANKELEATFSKGLATKCAEMTKAEEELATIKLSVLDLEKTVQCKQAENQSCNNHLSESREAAADLQKKLQLRDDFMEKLKHCLDKMPFEEVFFHSDNSLLDDEKVSLLLNDFLKLSKILREATAFCGRCTEEHFNGQIPSPPDSVLQPTSSPFELHHLDLIQGSHGQESSASLLSANLQLRKATKNLQAELDAALRSSRMSEEQLGNARRQIDLLVKQNEKKCDNGDTTEKDVKRANGGTLAGELKSEMNKLKLQLEMMQELNGLLQQQVDLRAADQSNASNAQQAMISSLSIKTEQLREEMNRLGTIADVDERGGKDDCGVSDGFTDEAQAEINRLRFVLSSTEGTVRMLGSKNNYYRSLLAEMGLSPLTCDKMSLRSDTSSTRRWSRRPRVNLAACGLATNIEERSSAPISTVRKSASFSAPVTPMKGPVALDLDFGILSSQLVETETLKRAVEVKEQTLSELQAEIEKLRLAPCCVLRDVECQTVGPELNVSAGGDQLLDGGAWKRVSESHQASELLRRRLEELAEFLERLLRFDENGLLDLSCLTPQKMASIREHLEKSKELSCTLSRSLLVLDNTVMSEVSDHGRDSFVEGRNRRSSASNCSQDGDCYATLVNSPAGGALSASAVVGRTPKSCSRSLALDETESGQPGSVNDDFLLVLNPKSRASKGSFSFAVANDELPTCSLSAFSLQHSFLSSTNLEEGQSAPKPIHAQEEHSMSESDSWSEPDRHVSQQRIGLESNQLTPGGHKMSSSSNTESEIAVELGNSFGRNRSGKACISGGDKPHLNSQELRLLAQVDELKEINGSICAELSLYQSICNDKGIATTTRRSSFSPSKPQRRGRSKSGDVSAAGSVDPGKSPKLDSYLREISALRKQLEKSIYGYDLLREQFEQRLAASPSGNIELNEEYANIIQNLYVQLENGKTQLDRKNLIIQDVQNEKAHLLAEIQELTEKFESYRETIESLQSMLGEQQKSSREACRKAEHLEAVAAAKEAALSEAKAAQDQLQQSMAKASQLLRDNETALMRLREVNLELEDECGKLRSEGERKEQEGRQRAEAAALLEEQAEEMKEEAERCQKIIQEQREDNEAFQRCNRELQHSVCAIEEAAENAARDAERIRLDKEQEVGELQLEKSRLESQLTELQTQLEAATTINSSFKAELQMYQKLTDTSDRGVETAGDPEAGGVSLLMSEIRSLRLQLERSVETNQALRAQLEKKTAPRGEKRLRLDITAGHGGWPSAVSSPETASSFSYTPAFRLARGDKAAPSSAEVRANNGQWDSGASVYSSPDLGIESDRSRISSLERRGKGSGNRTQYLEPGMPAGNGHWTVTNSAPPRIDARESVVPTTESGSKNPMNFTFPVYGGIALDLSESSRDREEAPEGRRSPYFVALPADYELLKKAVREGLGVLRTVRSKAKERLLTLRGQVRSTSDEAVTDQEYAAWKEAYLGCDALKACLQQGCHLVGQFWMAPLPLLAESQKASTTGGNEEHHLEEELMRLYHELAKEKQRAEDALNKLEAANRLKAGMEKAIVKQLNKTHNVLKKAKGNLEQQTHSAPSPQK